jgi:hypothetical protein
MVQYRFMVMLNLTLQAQNIHHQKLFVGNDLNMLMISLKKRKRRMKVKRQKIQPRRREMRKEMKMRMMTMILGCH